MTYSKAIYCRELKQHFPSSADAEREMRTTHRCMGASKVVHGSNIAAACRATARKKYVSSYGFQWAFANKIPKVWPEKVPRKYKPRDPATVANKVPVIRDDGRVFESAAEASRHHGTTRSYMCELMNSSKFGLYKRFKGHQFASVAVSKTEGWTWPTSEDCPAGHKRKLSRAGTDGGQILVSAATSK